MFIKYADLDRIKRLDLPVMMQASGITLKTNGNGGYVALCPFHDDKTPSLNLNIKGGMWVWHCFGCKAGGTVIDFVMKRESLSFIDAVKRLHGNGGDGGKGSGITLPPRVAKKPSTIDGPVASVARGASVDLDAIAEYYHKTLLGADKRGIEYLAKRGLNDAEIIKTFKIGYADGTLKGIVRGYDARQRLRELGILSSKENESLAGCVTFSIMDEEGKVVGLYGISVEVSRHLYLKGRHKGVFNHQALLTTGGQARKEIILTESIIDCLSIYKAGIRNVIPLYGTHGYTKRHHELFEESGIRKVYLALDNDEAGEKACKVITKKLSSLGMGCYRINWPPGIKDANQYFLDGGTSESFGKLIAEATAMAGERRLSTGPELIDYGDGVAIFSVMDDACGSGKDGKGLIYRARGVQSGSPDDLRLIITAEKDGRRHTDRLDMYSARNRLSFANRCARKLSLQPAGIEEDLLNIVSEIEELKSRLAEEERTGDKKARVLSEAEKEEALKFLQSADLLDMMASHLDGMGLVGEDENKKLAYLVATSRKLEQPLSALVRSQSSAGKSRLIETIAELMPEEDVEFFSRLTPQALYYMGKTQLKHKLLIVDERTGSEEADYSIRGLQSRNKLTMALPFKDPSTGKTRTVTIEIEGPIAYMESSTKSLLNAENTNRCFEMYMNESYEQTMRIQASQRHARTLDGWQSGSRREKIIALHRNAQRLLEPVKVVIDYAPLIEFPASWLRTRRDHDRFPSLIEAVAFLNQHRRRVKRDGKDRAYIESEIEDYRIAYDLARIALQDSLDDMSKHERSFLKELRDAVERHSAEGRTRREEYGFTRKDVRGWLGLPDYVVKRHMQKLEELEHVDVRLAGRGGRHSYRLTDWNDGRQLFRGLTTPDELAAKMAHDVGGAPASRGSSSLACPALV